MNKKMTLSLALMATLAFSMSSCSKSDEETSPSDTPKEKETTLTTETQKESAGGQDLLAGAKDKMKETITTMAGEAAKAFSLTDQGGKKVSLADYAGKFVVLEWVNPDCPYVKRHYQAQTLTKLYNDYSAKGVAFLAINSTKTYNQEKNLTWHTQHSLPYPILDDHTGMIGKLYSAKSTPHMFVLDKTGKVVYNGAIDDDPNGDKGDQAKNYVNVVLDDLLAGKTPSVTQTQPYGCSVKYAD